MAETVPSTLSQSMIRQYAELVGKHFDLYDTSGRASLEKLLSKINATLKLGEPFEDDESSHIDESHNFSINISRFASRQRDRFTIAHELGHYFLHYLHPKREVPLNFNRGGTGLPETQANIFASSLLMPETAFRAKFDELHGDKSALANIFDVSIAAVDVRAKVLGL